MKIRNEKIIEDTSSGSIEPCEGKLFCGPMSLLDIEVWEDALILKKVPYVLTYGETTLPLDFFRRDAEGQTFKQGYFLYREKT